MFGFTAGEAHLLSTFTLDYGLAWALRLPHNMLAIRSTAPFEVLVLPDNDVLFHSHILFDFVLTAEFPHISDSIF